jgi:hypothetical protein
MAQSYDEWAQNAIKGNSSWANTYKERQGQMPQYGWTKPNMTDQTNMGKAYNAYYKQATADEGFNNILSQGQKAYDPTNIAQYYNMAQGNLNRQAGNTGAYIGRQAGAHSTNMLNPSSFILGNISKSQEPYAEAGQQLQAKGAQAQQKGAADLTNLMYLINRAKQGDTDAAAELEYKYAALKAQQDANEAGFFDYAGIAAQALPFIL